MLAQCHTVPVLNRTFLTMPLILDLGLILFVYNGSFIGNYLVSKRFLQRAEPGIPLSQRMNNVLPVLTHIGFAQGTFSSKAINNETNLLHTMWIH